uniref:Subtilisin-like protease n=2 Tax=Anthurium amnicola TaxID=1678845 RepID=A0A1D1Y1N5_9ARAE
MEISRSPGVMAVFPNKGRKLHTTRSWGFLGLERDGRVPPESIWTKARYGEDTIIGNLDTGVWPESASFDDDGMGPVPKRWKGKCQGGSQHVVRCNRKLIGARFFNKGYVASLGSHNGSVAESPRDSDGHGTHTLSTAGGRFVVGANIFGFGNGTAKGGSPSARVAAYKVCWPPVNGSECFDADILAAFDAAIHDGVDVLSVSLGGDAGPYFNDGLAIGSFHAVKNGVSVVCSAGNSGPALGTVSNVAPWIITVAASTMDREFPSYAALGNGKRLKGQSLSPTRLQRNKFYPLISSADAVAANSTVHDAQLCFLGSLDSKKVRGKIVACLRGINPRVEKGQAVLQAGGSGMILANSQTEANEIIADAHVLPATHLAYTDGLSLFAYINSTRSPVAQITAPTTVVGTKPAPFMAAFSSLGPNVVNPEILKPDITAPGVSVLAAFTQATGPTDQPFDKRRVRFNSESGTSMSCPHISGVAGLLKTLHPDWSPSAIKSAIMTTARTRDNVGEAIDNSSFVKAGPFNYGAGHVRPNAAMDPGLVYDLAAEDYLNFLCALGYNSTQVATFSVSPYSCPRRPPRVLDLNYPSITVPSLSGRATTVARRVKNVGPPGTYTARVKAPPGVSVAVKPATLEFGKVGEERSFRVTVEAKRGAAAAAGEYVFGMLTWSDGVHHVRSPLVVRRSP